MKTFESLPPEILAQYNTITEKIVAAGYNVLNTLDPGFLEKVYENAMVIELREMGLTVEQQKLLKVYYKGHDVGFLFCRPVCRKSHPRGTESRESNRRCV